MNPATVTFQPDGRQVVVSTGRRVLAVVLDAQRPIGYSCRGLGVCVACVVWVKGPQSPITEAEAKLLEQVDGPLTLNGAQRRIACLASVEGDVSIQADYW